VQPVQAWPASQITGGRLGEVTAAAIRGATSNGNPMPAAITVQNFTKSRLETPLSLPLTFSKSRSFISALFCLGIPSFRNVQRFKRFSV
jgi:hypothetical protein